MSGDTTIQALKRLSYLQGREELSQGDLIGGQDYDDVYFIGGSISGVDIDNLVNPLAIVDGGTGETTATNALNALLPAQSGNSGKVLKTDGSNATWETEGGGSGITQLTGDVTAGPGSGSVAATLATVNANVGSFGSSTSIPSFTVNAKGLVTAASGNAVIAPAGTLSGSTLAAGVTASSLTSVGTLTGGATGAGFTVALGTSTVTGTLGDSNISSAATWNAKLSNITGYITAGTNVTLGGTGTSIDPYVVNATDAFNGDVVGPASSTDNAFARFDLTTGKLLQNGVVLADDSGNISGVVNLTFTGDLIGTDLTASSTSGVILKNNAGTQVMSAGASGSLNTAFAGSSTMVGQLSIAGTSSGAARLLLGEDTDNGSNTATLKAPDSLSGDVTITLPSTTGTLPLTTDITNRSESIMAAASDETTNLTTGNAKVTFRMPFALTLTSVRASVNTAPTGSTIIVDINENGSSILSTKLSIDAGEKTSTTAAVQPVISDANLADDAEITIDLDQVGSSTAGTGLKVTLTGNRV